MLLVGATNRPASRLLPDSTPPCTSPASWGAFCINDQAFPALDIEEQLAAPALLSSVPNVPRSILQCLQMPAAAVLQP
jgi:hypothetical protein